MANVISQSIKKGIKREYQFRIIGTMMFLLSLSILAATVLMLPAFLSARSDLRSLEYEIAAVQGVGSDILDSESHALATALNARISFIDSQQLTPVETYSAYAALLNALPRNLNYTQIDFSAVVEEKKKAKKDDPEAKDTDTKEAESPTIKHQVVVSGVAAARSDLAAAIRNLQTVSWIKSVDYPISDLSEAVDVSFTITMEYDPELIPEVRDLRQYLVDLEAPKEAESEAVIPPDISDSSSEPLIPEGQDNESTEL